MKPKAITLIIALLFGAVNAVFAQDYDDDIYFNPSKAPKPKKKATTTYQQPNAIIYYPVEDYPAADTYTPTGGREVSVDDYNRRGIFGDEQSKTPVTDSILNSEFANTRRIERYYNPQIVSGSDDAELAQAYYAQPANVNIIINDPWSTPYYSGYWGWGYPWRYSSWAWNSWNWGWGPSWGWTPGWDWGPSWGWAPSRPSRPGAVGNYRPGNGYRPGRPAAGNYRPSTTGGAYRPGSNGGYRPGNSNSGYRPGRGNVRGNGNNSYSRPSNNNSNNSNYTPSYRPGNNRNSGSSWGSGSTGGFRGGSGMGGGSRGGGGGRGRH